MNIQQYIDSGILELYCLGSLSPEEEKEVQYLMAHYARVQAEVGRIQAALENFAEMNAVAPPEHMEEIVSVLIENLGKEAQMDIKDLPLINKYSDYNAWRRLVPRTIPADLAEKRYCKILTRTADVTQMLVISTTDFEDELHDDLLESFLILEGTCDCTVGDKVSRMGAGDFMEIPLYAHHDVKVHSPYVIAILQRIAI